MYDLIGDIHGHADELTALLTKLDYKQENGVFQHPDRQVIFLGDFIDRGPKIREVLEIVRPMIDSGKALAVMGNHEFNAIAYHTPDPDAPGAFLRPRSEKNRDQHIKTLNQMGNDLGDYVDWFKTLPLWLDLPQLRVVHACWAPRQIALINELTGDTLSDQFLVPASRKGSDEYEAIEQVLKGIEIPLPNGITFLDKDKHPRKDVRIRWFQDLNGKSFREASLPTELTAPEDQIDESVLTGIIPYPATEKPVFFGHYWLDESETALLADNACCLDFSVAKEGFLAAYRFNGEQTLKVENFVVAG